LGGDGGGSGDVFSILMVEMFFFLFSLAIVFLLILTLIPKPSRRLDNIGLSLLVRELAALGHTLLRVSTLYAWAILFNCSNASVVEPSQKVTSPFLYQLSTNLSTA
jgi:hypothetical protein